MLVLMMLDSVKDLDVATQLLRDRLAEEIPQAPLLKAAMPTALPGVTETVSRTDGVRDQVLDLIRAHEPILAPELQGHLPGISSRGLAAYLAHLTRNGKVIRSKDGNYVVAV